MSTFKCKMCGASLEISEGATIVECEFCGTNQTLPKLNDEKRTNLYDRANHFRRSSEFDKAAAIYEQILNEDDSDAEVYWSLVLCHYGIQYVLDPTTNKRVPTVNRAQYTSIFDDNNYKLAIKKADMRQKILYEEEAKAINEIQKGILEISQKEEPFDVFICYKESDNGKRTRDSVLANDLYYALTQEGFKVFFARITLEDKLGTAYEPYIFAALNSAKVMVVLGTKEEYFNAVWVKNEWSRYLSLIKQGQKKVLIPAYRGMDPYDLPTEFSHLQAQNMENLGFMQDLVRGIKKITGKDKVDPAPVTERVIINSDSPDTAPLLKRAYLFVEDGEYDSADEYSEKVLDINPECAEAYIVKLMIERKVRRPEDLGKCKEPLTKSNHYQKAVRFATPEYKKVIVGYNDAIVQGIEESNRMSRYSTAIRSMNAKKYDEAIRIFQGLGKYKDSEEKVAECKKLDEDSKKQASYDKARGLLESKAFDEAIALFESLKDYKDAKTQAEKARETKEKARKDAIYHKAVNRANSQKATEEQLTVSIKELQEIAGYRDVDEKIKTYSKILEDKIAKRKADEEKARIKAEEERRAREKAEELRKMKELKKKKRRRNFVIIGLPIIALLIAAGFALYYFVLPPVLYDYANGLFEEENYTEAEMIYDFLGDHENSQQYSAVISAMKTIDYGYLETGISDLLKAGVPVTVAYDTDGGEVASAVVGAKTASKSTVVNKTYNSVDEFTGFDKPTKTGYTFGKWEFQGYDYTLGDAFVVSLKATWVGDSYTIGYSYNGGEVATTNPSAYSIDTDSFTLTNPTKAGYTFIGWTYDGVTTPVANVTIEKGSTGNLYFTANWKANTYKVTFDADGGTVDETSMTVTYAEKVTLPTPTKNGYSFDGWYNGTKKVTSGKWTYTDNVTLKAKWKSNQYTITFQDVVANKTKISVIYDYNYTGSTITTVELENGKTLSYPTNPTRNGYVFTGWYTDSKCTTRFTFTDKITKDTTLYAGWMANESNAHSVNVINPNQYSSSSASYSISNSGSSSGYQKYVYFMANESGSHTIYYKNGYSGSYYKTYIGIKNMTTGVEIKATEACSSTSYNSVSFTCNAGDLIRINLYQYSYSEYAYFYFTGFSAMKSTAVASIDSSASYSYNSGSQATMTISFGDQINLPTLSRKGYSFLGWYNGNTKIENGTWNIAGDVILTPKFEAGGNTILLDANGGTVETSSIPVKYQQNYTLPTPTRTGYTFEGWYNGSTKVQNGIWTRVDDITLVAKWTANTYKITYTDSNNPSTSVKITYNYNYSGKSNTTTTLEHGASLSYPTAPTRSGYIFTGWYTDSSCKSRYSFTGEISEDITLYAGWVSMKTSYYSNNFVNAYSYTSSSNSASYGIYGYNSGYATNVYLVANENGTHKICYKNSSSSSSYRYYITITNMTTGKSIMAETVCSSTSYTGVSFECNAGDAICISMYYYSYAPTAYLYFDGFKTPTSTAKVNIPTGLVYSKGNNVVESVSFGSAFSIHTPTRKGYTFGGWFNGSTKVESGTWSGTSDITLTPKWTANSYKVTLNANGGTVSNSYLTVTYDTAFTLPTPTKTGATFLGWYDSNGVKYESGTWNYISDLQLTAKWSTNAYTITFNDVSVSGSNAVYSSGSVYSIGVSYGDSVTLPTPTRTGYTFDGWYNGSTKYESGSWKYDGSISLTAKWTANTYTLTLDANGGSVTPTSVTVTYGSTITLPTPTWAGRSFSGWYNGDSKVDSGSTWTGLSDATLKARWDTKQYTITYSDTGYASNKATITYNYNYSGASNNTTSVNQGSTLSYPSNPTRSGYIFTGWYLNSSCTSKYNFNGEITGDLTLYAGWVAVKSGAYSNNQINAYNYTTSTTYGNVYGTSASYASNYYVVANESGTHAIYYANNYSSSSYKLYVSITNTTTGKTILAETVCSNTSYATVSFDCNAGDVICISAYRYNYSSYLYMYFDGFTKPTSTAKVNLPDGYIYSSGSKQTTNFTYGDSITLPTPTRTGYTFGGWYNGSTKVESGKFNYETNITLTPKWTVNSYKVTYDANGGTVSPTSATVSYGASHTLPTPTKSGATFLGWYDDNGVKYESGTWNYASDIKLTAKWSTNAYTLTYSDIAASPKSATVTFNYNYSGKSNTTTTVSNGNTLSYPSDPTRSGYIFTGWYTDSACKTRYSFAGEITENITLYAGWHALDSGAYSNYTLNAYSYTTSSNYAYNSIYGTSASYATNFYFVANESGAHKFYYRNSSSSSSYALYVSAKNLTTGKSVLAQTSCNSTSYTAVSFECNAGDVICISAYKYSYSSSLYMYFDGFTRVSSSAKANVPDGYIYSSGSKQTVNFGYGDSITLPTPYRAGYTFAGWYNGSTKVESGKFNYETNVTLTPKWTVNSYKITYDANGGTVSPTSTTVTYGTSFTLPTPTRTGYTFDGWYDGTVKVSSGTWNYTSDKKLTAKWIAKGASITYEDISASPTSVTVTYNYNYSGKSNSTVTVSNSKTLSYPSEPTRSGYIFTGWYTDSACKNRFYFGETLTSDITLYAGWIAQKSSYYSSNVIDAASYNTNVKFYSKSISSKTSPDNIYVLARESGLHKVNYMNSNSGTSYQYYITITNMTTGTVIISNTLCSSNTGYTTVPFICSAGDVICIAMNRYSSSTSAYLYFEGFNKVTSTSVCDLGSASYTYTPDVDKTESVKYGDSVTLLTPYRAGYTFAGWYNGSTKVESGTWKYDTAVTLTAKWTAKTSKITLNADGGTVSSTSVNATYGSSVTLPTPTKKGYTFIGWYNGNVEYKSGTWYGSSDITLTAKWATGASIITLKDVYEVPENIKVTFSYNYTNGGVYTTYTLSNGSTLSVPSSLPTRSGYVFTGWYTDEACKTRYDFTGKIVKDTTIYAGWIAQKTGGYSNAVINGYSYNSSNNYYYKSINGSETSTDNIYIIAYESGTHKISYKNSNSSYYNNLYVAITNLTTGKTILTNTSCQSTSYTDVSFTCNAGDVICVSSYKFYNSSTLYLYTTGFSSVQSTAKCEIPNEDLAYSSGSTYTMNAVKGQTITLPTPYREGYTFDGWYYGSTKVESGTWTYDESVTLTAKWK